MLKLHPQFVCDENDKAEGVILKLKEFDKVVEILEQLYDYRALKDYKYDPSDTVSAEEVDKIFVKKYGQ